MKQPSLSLVCLFAVACGGNPTLDRVNRTGAEARARPGAVQVVAYVTALRAAFDAKAFADPNEGVRLGEEALVMLDSAAAASAADAPELIGYKGLLLVSLGRHELAWATFQESMRLEPNFIAAGNMVIVYGTANKPDQVGETCATTVPHLARKGDVDELYRFIELCAENMNALDDASAMSWADQPTRDFHAAERARRQRESAGRIEAAQAQRDRENQVMHEMEICTSSCREQTGLCQADCGRDRVCRNDCVTANNACVDRCGAAAKRELGVESGY
jgi:hypothetical protein